MMDIQVKLLAMLSLLLVFSGCGNLGSSSKEKPVTNTQTYVAEVGLTTMQRFTKSLEYLEYGNDRQALVELEAYLVEVPRSTSAKKLLEQIQTDSREYFPEDYFTVELDSGASLSTLAQRYLGSALKFYALAKYNNISNPSRVNIGQQIKIPATELALKVKEDKKIDDEKALASLNTSTDEIVDEIAEMDVEVVESEVEDEVKTDEDLAIIDEMTIEENSSIEETIPVVEKVIVSAESLLKDIKTLNEFGLFSQSIVKVEELKNLGELNSANQDLILASLLGYADEVEETDPLQASKYYFEAAQINLKKNDQFSAFKNFKLASELDEENTPAMEEMLVLQKDISDKYHREASTAFRRQELDLAIATWDKVLAVKPDHSNAQLYRAQAIELKERIEKIKSN